MDTTGSLILIVDDEPNNVDILEKRLRASGFQTITASNGADALRIAQTEHPDLVILDVMMPGMSGHEVCQQLKSMESTADIPVLFLSARVEVDDRVEGLKLGAADYMTKPFHFKELVARLETILEHSQALRKIKEEYVKLREISIVDNLTGLYNRQYLMERLEEESNRAKRYKYPVSCLMIDIDFFKSINDQYGHLAGDDILADVALVLKNSTRVVDLVARFGGEEFTIFLPQTGSSGAEVVAKKIHENLAVFDFTINGQSVPVTVSIGIAVYNGVFWENGLAILRAADQALYEAKNRGRNQTIIRVTDE